jgi:hypothetical protein
MAEAELDTDYAVLVAERRGVYELRIRELLLVVRDPDLRKAYEELMGRKREIIESARAFGTLDEVPKAERPTLFKEAPHGLFGRVLSRLLGN